MVHAEEPRHELELGGILTRKARLPWPAVRDWQPLKGDIGLLRIVEV